MADINNPVGTLTENVGTVQCDTKKALNAAIALKSFVAQNYNSDAQLQQLADDAQAFAQTASDDAVALTTEHAHPPQAVKG